MEGMLSKNSGILMLPGPTEVSKNVLKEFSKKIQPHYGDKWLKDHKRIKLKLKKIFKTNNEIFVSVQIETVEAVKNQDEIIKTPGIDGIFLGPGDLSVSLGVPGEMMHKKVIKTMEPIVENSINNGKHVGTLGLNPEQASFWNQKGVNWIVSSATRFLISGTKNYIETIKNPINNTEK